MPSLPLPLTLSRLEHYLAKFPALRIGLIGDLFLDRYLEIDGTITEISIETGLDAYQVLKVRNQPGALGTVLNNLAALEVGRLVPVTILGDDGHGDDLLRSLRSLPVETTRIVRSPDRLTPTYTKPLLISDEGTIRELNRLDVRSRHPLEEDLQQRLRAELREEFARCDGWIVMDQMPESDCGVVTRALRDELSQLSSEHPEKLILVDSRRHLQDFSCGSLKGNRAEILAAAEMSPDAGDEAIRGAAGQLAAQTERTCYCTLGEQGVLVTPPGGTSTLVPGFPVTGPVDIVGAGDSATSGLVSALLAGAHPEEAAVIANLIASITVQQIGTTGVATPGQVIERYHAVTSPSS
jgi:rfaE bifunctional protein kinase chain/domain